MDKKKQREQAQTQGQEREEEASAPQEQAIPATPGTATTQREQMEAVTNWFHNPNGGGLLLSNLNINAVENSYASADAYVKAKPLILTAFKCVLNEHDRTVLDFVERRRGEPTADDPELRDARKASARYKAPCSFRAHSNSLLSYVKLCSINTKIYLFFKKLGEKVYGADDFCKSHPPAAPGIRVSTVINENAAMAAMAASGQANTTSMFSHPLHGSSSSTAHTNIHADKALGITDTVHYSDEAIFKYMIDVMYETNNGGGSGEDGDRDAVLGHGNSSLTANEFFAHMGSGLYAHAHLAALSANTSFLGSQEGVIISNVDFTHMLRLYPTAEHFVKAKKEVMDELLEKLSDSDKIVLSQMKEHGAYPNTGAATPQTPTTPTSTALDVANLSGSVPETTEIEKIRNRSRQISTKLGIWYRKLGIAAYGEDEFNRVYREIQMPLQRGRPLKKRLHELDENMHMMIDEEEDNANLQIHSASADEGQTTPQQQNRAGKKAAANSNGSGSKRSINDASIDVNDDNEDEEGPIFVGDIHAILSKSEGSTYENIRAGINLRHLRKLYPSAQSYYAHRPIILNALRDKLPPQVQAHDDESNEQSSQAKLIVWFNKLGQEAYGEEEFNRFLYAVEPPSTRTPGGRLDGTNGIENPRIRYVNIPTFNLNPASSGGQSPSRDHADWTSGPMVNDATRAVYPTVESYVRAQKQIMRGLVEKLSTLEQHLLLSVFTPQQQTVLDLDMDGVKQSIRQIHSKLVGQFKSLGVAVYGHEAFSACYGRINAQSANSVAHSSVPASSSSSSSSGGAANQQNSDDDSLVLFSSKKKRKGEDGNNASASTTSAKKKSTPAAKH
jgi:hypothetical protein